VAVLSRMNRVGIPFTDMDGDREWSRS
jgi:hypothetical protein